jgi:asparagine synthase (glutamine-hydrolysing)
MSVIFGIRCAFGQTTRQQDLLQLAAATEPYAPDGTFVYAQGEVGMGFQPFHTTERSRLESQPALDAHGNLLVLDGRLDNQEGLRHALHPGSQDIADSALVLLAFACWGEDCFSHLIGDWALALWCGVNHTLYLARDHAGSRTLFFRQINGGIEWSSYLETFFTQGISLDVDHEYVGCFLGALPIRNLTPYRGIRAVPPAHFLVVQEDTITPKAHWNCLPQDTIRYHSDSEYEEHFLALFKTSVDRRTIPGAPVVAELSGGMDSTAIVCMSDYARKARGAPPTDLLDTVSYYDDTEPNWNETPYFSVVEARRGKVGAHIDASLLPPTFEPADSSRGVYLFPGADSTTIHKEEHRKNSIGKYRVILSGLGGDELLGGVPTPAPELADYLVSGNLKQLLKRATEWCIVARTPLPHMLYETVTFTAGLYRQPHSDPTKLPPWLTPQFRKLCLDLQQRVTGESSRLGLAPTAVSNGCTWWSILESLPHLVPGVLRRYEYRYPYLDRDLVDFLLRIPRDQIVRPGRRRSLMRRALKTMVPTEILERRRKAFLIRGPLASIRTGKEKIGSLFAAPLSAEYGFIDPMKIRSRLELIARGKETRLWKHLMKAIAFELWLRDGSADFPATERSRHLRALSNRHAAMRRQVPC